MKRQEKKRKKYLEQKLKQECYLPRQELFELKSLYEKESEQLNKMNIVLLCIGLTAMVIAFVSQIASILMRL